MDNFFDALLTGLLTSLIFLILLYFLRPKIKISDCIAEDENDSNIFRFKIINKSFFSIYDIKVRMFQCNEINGINAKNTKFEKLELKVSNIWTIPPFNIRHLFQKEESEKNIKGKTNYAATFRTDDAKMKEWGKDENTYLTVEILAKHGFSGFSKVFTKDYHSPKHKLKKGKFLSGNSCFIN